MHIDNPDTDSGTEDQKPPAVWKDQPRELGEVVDKYYQLAQKVPINVRDSVMQPVSEEWRLLEFYFDERKRLAETGVATYMLSKDRERMAKYEKVMGTTSSAKIRNLEAGHWELRANRDSVDAHRYHKLVRVQGKVVSYVRKYFHIRAKEAQRMKHNAKEGEPFYILRDERYCSYPPKPNLDCVIAIKDNEGPDLFASNEEENEDNNNINKLYANETKADA